MSDITQNVRVGVGVIVARGDRILLGRRKGTHGAGTWALPGGHLEFGETVGACAKREVFEETGLRIGAIRHVDFTNDVFTAEMKHYVTLFVAADCHTGEPTLQEPDKCSEWAWFKWSALPEPLFLPLQTLIENRRAAASSCPAGIKDSPAETAAAGAASGSLPPDPQERRCM